MKSIENNPAIGTSPFATAGSAPAPGGSAAARFQSILLAAGNKSNASVQPGLSPAAGSSTVGSASKAASGAAGSSGTSNSDAVISANDFLTLLVTEMQNQDPTADVDPNAYIDQLVQINSLEQLISINQNLAAVLGAASSTPTGGSSGTAAPVTGVGGVGQSAAIGAGRGAPVAGASPASAIAAARQSSRPATVEGNLSAPGAAPAAATVGRALSGRARGAGAGHAIRDIPTRQLR